MSNTPKAHLTPAEDVAALMSELWPKPEDIAACRVVNEAAEKTFPVYARIGEVIRASDTWTKMTEDSWMIHVLGVTLHLMRMSEDQWRAGVGVSPCAVHGWDKGFFITQGHDNFPTEADAKEACLTTVKKLYLNNWPYDYILHDNVEPEFPIEDMAEPEEPIVIHVPPNPRVH